MDNDQKVAELVLRLLPSARTVIAVLVVALVAAIIAAGYGLSGKAKAEQRARESERRVADLQRQLAGVQNTGGNIPMNLELDLLRSKQQAGEFSARMNKTN